MARSAENPRRRPSAIDAVEVDLPITVGQFVKAAGLASTGGEAKLLVTTGEVSVNGAVEVRRGHKLVADDIVAVGGHAARVVVRPTATGDTSSDALAPPARS